MNDRWPIMGWKIDTPVHEAIGQAMGYASRCWDADGVFQSTEAAAVTEELIDLLQAKQWDTGNYAAGEPTP